MGSADLWISVVVLGGFSDNFFRFRKRYPPPPAGGVEKIRGPEKVYIFTCIYLYICVDI